MKEPALFVFDALFPLTVTMGATIPTVAPSAAGKGEAAENIEGSKEVCPMKLQGSQMFPVGQQRLWEILQDPEVLREATPGCEWLRPVGDDEYDVELKIGVAAISGRYEGRIAIRDKEPPNAYTLVIDVKGGTGFVNGQARISLAPVDDANTRLTFEGEAQVGGLIAGVGQRMLEGVGKFIVSQFFKNLEREVRYRAG